MEAKIHTIAQQIQDKDRRDEFISTTKKLCIYVGKYDTGNWTVELRDSDHRLLFVFTDKVDDTYLLPVFFSKVMDEESVFNTVDRMKSDVEAVYGKTDYDPSGLYVKVYVTIDDKEVVLYYQEYLN